MRQVRVVAAVIRRGEAILVSRRHAAAERGGQWEFPGGKVEPDEGPEACLRRELAEELGIEAEIGPEVHRTDHRYPNGISVRLLFFQVLRYAGAPENREFERIAWARPDELFGFDFRSDCPKIPIRLLH